MTDRRTPVDHELNARTPLDHLEVGLALLRTADNPATPPRPRRFCARLAAAHFAAASAMQALGVGEHTLDTRPALVLAGPSAGLMATVHRTAEVYSADVRPHVPHVDNYGDPRLHLIVDGVSACGLQSPQLGTHDPAETDCRDCDAALQRGGDEAGLPPDGQAAGLVRRAAVGAAHGGLRAAEELVLVRAMHSGLLDDDRPVPRWDKIEGDPDAVEGLDPMTIAIGRSLAGELIDMTQAVVDYAAEHDLRHWQCRHCGRGRVMGHMRDVDVHAEKAEVVDHEAHCEFAGANA